MLTMSDVSDHLTGVSVKKGPGTRTALLVLLAVLATAPPALAQPGAPAGAKAAAARPGAPLAPPAAATNPYRPNRFAGRAGQYYRYVWGVDSLSVKLAESGQLIRFTWRVLDPQKARLLNDKKLEPSLVDPQAGVSLVVPAVDKIGKLRQSAACETGKSYWMVFSNKGRRVKRGDRVNVVIGQFRAEGLAVE